MDCADGYLFKHSARMLSLGKMTLILSWKEKHKYFQFAVFVLMQMIMNTYQKCIFMGSGGRQC